MAVVVVKQSRLTSVSVGNAASYLADNNFEPKAVNVCRLVRCEPKAVNVCRLVRCEPKLKA